jgi:hypothetical protein
MPGLDKIWSDYQKGTIKRAAAEAKVRAWADKNPTDMGLHRAEKIAKNLGFTLVTNPGGPDYAGGKK